MHHHLESRGAFTVGALLIAGGAVLLAPTPALAQIGGSEVPPDFDDPAVFAAGSFPYGLAVGQVVGDSLPDVVVLDAYTNLMEYCPQNESPSPLEPRKVRVFRNTGLWDDPALGLDLVQTIDICQFATPAEVAIADVDGIYGPDLVISVAGKGWPYGYPNQPYEDEQGVYVCLQQADGMFGAPVRYPTNLPVRALVVANFNVDLQGYRDVVVAAEGCERDDGRDVVYLLQNDHGVFLPPAELDLDLQSTWAPGDLAVGDFRAEPWAPTPWDIACPQLYDPRATLLRNETLHPGDPWMFEVDPVAEPCADTGGDGVYYSTVASAKFGSDDHWDFAAVEWRGHNVAVFLGDGQGHFSSLCRPIADPETTWGVAAGHLNGGIRPDLVVTVTGAGYAGSAAVVLGKTDGTFQGPDPDPCYMFGLDGLVPALVEVADLNDDGFGDIITTNHGSDTISVLINRLKVSPP